MNFIINVEKGNTLGMLSVLEHQYKTKRIDLPNSSVKKTMFPTSNHKTLVVFSWDILGPISFEIFNSVSTTEIDQFIKLVHQHNGHVKDCVIH